MVWVVTALQYARLVLHLLGSGRNYLPHACVVPALGVDMTTSLLQWGSVCLIRMGLRLARLLAQCLHGSGRAGLFVFWP